MLKKSIYLTLILCVAILFLATLVLSSTPQPVWDLIEGAENVTGYASDSGSFALQDGLEFTAIYVFASVYNGNTLLEDMTAIAHMEISSGPTFHSEAEANGSDRGDLHHEYDLAGNGYSGSSWYWSINTQNNTGKGKAFCKWAWNQE